MTLKELINRLNAFNCEALADKEVAHFFSSSNAYGYKEVIDDVVYNPKNEMFMIKCKDPESCNWDFNNVIKVEQ